MISPPKLLLISLCIVFLSYGFTYVAYADNDDPPDIDDSASADELSADPDDLMSPETDDPSGEVSQDVPDPVADEEPEPEYEPVEGEITDGEFKAYVLGCLTFFVVVIIAYFGYKFFNMFF